MVFRNGIPESDAAIHHFIQVKRQVVFHRQQTARLKVKLEFPGEPHHAQNHLREAQPRPETPSGPGSKGQPRIGISRAAVVGIIDPMLEINCQGVVAPLQGIPSQLPRGKTEGVTRRHGIVVLAQYS